MNDTSFLGLVQNAALLLAVAFIFDVAAVRWHTGQSSFRQAFFGLAIGAIGIAVMLTPWTFAPGIVFDTRSVLIGISGLFFGPVPTAIAMAMTAAFRYYLGGTGAWTGVAVILASGVIGVAWRHFRRRPLAEISWRELYLFGMVIHLAMLAIMLTLPWETALRVLSTIALPVLVIYPPGTALMGVLMANRLRRERAGEEREKMLLWQQGVNLLQQSLLTPAALEEKLRAITDRIVSLFDADFCRIWLIQPGDLCEQGCIHADVNEEPHICRYRDRCLHLLASSGRYTHTDGTIHRRVPFGCYMIGRVASDDDHKFLTNDVQNDPRIHNREWARELGLVSFVGYQLRVPDGKTLGVLALFAKNPISPPEDAILDGLSSAVALVIQRDVAEKSLRQTLENLRKAIQTTIQVMVSAVEIRDPYTAGHQIRSADLARAIATEMGLPKEKIDGIRMAGSIHDIGKLSVPAEILTKPTRLTDIEFSLIKEHSRKGYEMLKDVESSWPLAEMVYQHHERMDGSGYPRKLKGDEILMEARIMGVADVVESMASHRPYRPALGIDVALDEIAKNKGVFYDQDVVDACLKLFRDKGFELI